MSTLSPPDALQRFETIWTHVECGISIVDADSRRILAINPVAARMFGDNPEKIIGKKCHKFICPAEECSCPIMDMGQIVDRSERKFIKANGESIPIIKSVAKIDYNGRLALLESFTDISSLKDAEARLLLLGVAEEASRAKSEFLSRMSHEIRTPLNAIIGMVKIAEKAQDIEKLQYCLSMIGASSGHLLGIVNDVLDMAKIESGKLELERAPFSVEQVLMETSGLIAESVEEKQIRLKVFLRPDMRTRFLGDELRLSQIIANLLSNAAKFTPQGGHIKVYAEEAEILEGRSRVRFRIVDSGIGMTREQIGKLFKAFEQADTSISRRFGGTGLGLTIARSLAEKMNGCIRVASTPGQGSTFIVDVELAHAPEDSAKALPARPRHLNILLVQPDAEICAQFSALVAFPGWTVDVAANGREALQHLRSVGRKNRPYDLVFADRVLPDMNALELAQALEPERRGHAFILMTSFLQWSGIDEQTREAGVYRFLPMPLFPSLLAKTISCTRTSDRSERQPEESSPDFSHVTLLLAEDIAINREIFCSLLEETGATVDTAANGLEAVERFRASPERYTVIVMDVHMPEMNGYEATAAIRALDVERAATVPIIAMTANVFSSDIEKCLAAGMNAHLAKPIDCAAVFAAIRRYAAG